MGDKIYFISDLHLGFSSDNAQRIAHEEKIVDWLQSVDNQAKAIYFVGDIFDYWFEYKQVVPRGFSRFLGQLSSMRKKNIEIHFFTGNHDMWMFDYFLDEYGIPIYREPQFLEIDGKKLYVAHGDGLGPGDHSYKLMKRIFTNRLCQWCFARLHPNFALRLMKACSNMSRNHNDEEPHFLGEEEEWLIIHSKEILESHNVDYLIYGHRHLPIDYHLGESRYINLGDWIEYFSYAVLDGGELRLDFYKSKYREPFG